MGKATWPQSSSEQLLDCVRMKEELQSRIYEATKDMTREERDAYRKRQAEKFRRRIEHLAPAMAAESVAETPQS
jgi:acyl-CoA reductase-like NAD-dependent aldehyde dehydrogenase